MQQLPPQFKKDFSSGMVTNVNESILPEGTVALGMNVDFDEVTGAAVSRLGTGVVNAQVVDGKTCNGLHNFRDTVGSGSKLFAVFNVANDSSASIYDAESGSASLASDTASKKTYFLTFLDSCLRLNGTDAPKAWNGSSWITTGGAFDLANLPGTAEPKYCIEWQDRVYVAGDTSNPDKVYYSSTPTAGAISWTSGNGTVDIEPEDGGGGITGFGKVPGYVLVFKERSLKRWNFDSAFPETLINIGTSSQWSVVNVGGLCFFYSASSKSTKGFYVTNGDRPIPISHQRDNGKQIKKWIDAIPTTYDDDVSGWGTENYVYWSIGDVTVDGVAYTNVVLKYNYRLDQWSVRSYPSEFRVFSSFVTSSDNVIVAGDDDGCVIQLDKASTYTDYNAATGSTLPINWIVQLQEEKFGFNQVKEITDRIIVNSREAEGTRLEIGINPQKNTESKLIVFGEVESPVAEMPVNEAIRGNFFNIVLKGAQTGGRMTLKEVEFPSVIVTENYT